MSGAAEWLLANGLGGYAMGPIDGPPSRGYHGYLIAATAPPDGRMLLVAGVETWLEVDGRAIRLDAWQASAGEEPAEPPPSMTTSRDGTLTVRWPDVGGVAVELRAWMVRDANATVLRWRRLDGDRSRRVRLDLTPLITCRDHHPGSPEAPAPSAVITPDPWPRVDVGWGAGLPDLRLAASAGTTRPMDRRVPVYHADDAARGTSPDGVLHAVASFSVDLDPGRSMSLVASTGTGSVAAIPEPSQAAETLAAAIGRGTDLVALAGTMGDDSAAGLALAADRFIVRRRTEGAAEPAVDPADAQPGVLPGVRCFAPAADPGRTINAGYPWFGDWGRDTMIALPGLALATGRAGEAAGILRTWAGLLRDGLLPNHFPTAGGEPSYHSVDAPLWFIHAIGEHELATGDPSLALELRKAVEHVVRSYSDGTRFGIGVDPHDGLVRAGEGDVQPTWMDAKVGGVPITPRHGKAVEIQALWVNALLRAAHWAELAGDTTSGARHAAAAALAGASFRHRFWRPDLGWLADVVDGPGGDEVALRPNQLLALSLPHPLVDKAVGRAVLDAVGRHLVVPGALRSLAPFEPGYCRSFQGPPAVRDAAYHQGTAWTWLVGPWVDAVARFRGEAAAREAAGLALDALDPGRTGAIPELLEPEPPHESRGCPWQAWGVAELLRVRRRWSA